MVLTSWLSNPAKAAGRGLLRMQEAYSGADPKIQTAWQEGDRVLSDLSVPENGPIPGEVRAIASRQLLTASAAVSCQVAGLEAIHGGLSGPVGQALAAIGLEALKKAATPTDQLELARGFLTAIESWGNNGESAVAATARHLGKAELGAAQVPGFPTSDPNGVVAAQETALTMLSEGVTGSADEALKKFGARFNQVSHLGVPNYLEVNESILGRIESQGARQLRNHADRQWQDMDSRISLEYETDRYAAAAEALQSEILTEQREFFDR